MADHLPLELLLVRAALTLRDERLAALAKARRVRLECELEVDGLRGQQRLLH